MHVSQWLFVRYTGNVPVRYVLLRGASDYTVRPLNFVKSGVWDYVSSPPLTSDQPHYLDDVAMYLWWGGGFCITSLTLQNCLSKHRRILVRYNFRA
jgi:hypothetical protein